MLYDKMIEVTLEESRRKTWIAQQVINEMLEKNERISVAELTRRTKLSRGFFYKNPTVRKELDAAIRRQKEIFKENYPVIRDENAEKMIIELRSELLTYKEMNGNLIKENERLQLTIMELQQRKNGK